MGLSNAATLIQGNRKSDQEDKAVGAVAEEEVEAVVVEVEEEAAC
jgi:hypothetical protein